MRCLLLSVLAAIFLTWMPVASAQPEAGSKPIEVADLGPDDLAPFLDYLKRHGASPIDYLVKKCEQHEVVILGEVHWIRENCTFIADALAPLYRRAGVRQLATEFVRSRDTERANRLVCGSEFDEEVAVQIFRDGPWPIWGFKEYLDILRAAWKLNRSLPEDTERFRIAGLDSDWSQYDLWFTYPKDRKKQFDVRLARENNMAQVMEKEAFEAKRRTLVHVGHGHAILCHGLRLGTQLYKKYGDRLFQISLHRRETTAGSRQTARITRLLEDLHAKNGSRPVGFDILGTPFENLTDKQTMWHRALKDPRFVRVSQGYVILEPLDRLHDVTWIKGFINDALFEKARAVAERAGYVKKDACPDAAALDQGMAERFSGKQHGPSQEKK